MIKHNGNSIIERDEVGEIPYEMESSQMRKACDVFFAKRGETFPTLRQRIHNAAERAKRMQKFCIDGKKKR